MQGDDAGTVGDEPIRIARYDPSLNDACLALEALCAQGESFRLSFQRAEFHRRAASYERSEILVALSEGGPEPSGIREAEGGAARGGGTGLAPGRVVGTVAWALKDVLWRGEQRKGAFFFDARVHPEFRRRGVAKMLIAEAYAHADAAGAHARYTYCVDDNRASKALGSLMGAVVSGRYRYLVWPVYRRRAAGGALPREITPSEAHEAYLREAGPFDFHCDPLSGGPLQGHVASYSSGSGRASCSLWSNAGILEEKVERIPRYYDWMRTGLASWPLRLKPWPHVPAPGEILKSWLIYDFRANDGREAVALMGAINDLALKRGLRFCHVVVPDPTPAWLPALRAVSPRLFSPLIPYCLLTGATPGHESEIRPGPFERIYVDIRDL